MSGAASELAERLNAQAAVLQKWGPHTNMNEAALLCAAAAELARLVSVEQERDRLKQQLLGGEQSSPSAGES